MLTADELYHIYFLHFFFKNCDPSEYDEDCPYMVYYEEMIMEKDEMWHPITWESKKEFSCDVCMDFLGLAHCHNDKDDFPNCPCSVLGKKTITITERLLEHMEV